VFFAILVLTVFTSNCTAKVIFFGQIKNNITDVYTVI